MSVARRLLLGVIFIVGCDACFHPPEFSIIPTVSNPIVLEYYEWPTGDTVHNGDSVSVSFAFTDGDGDLGFDSNDPNDVQGKYANKYFFDFKGNAIDFGTQTLTSKYFYNGQLDPNYPNSQPFINDSLLTFSLRGTPPFDTLPDFVTPYSCTRYTVIEKPDSTFETLYSQLNKHYYNMFLDIYVKDDVTNEFKLFDFTTEYVYPNCDTFGFNGRFPLLAADPSHPGPQEGHIQYGLVSTAWQPLFGAPRVLRFGIQIEDRATHESNYLTTDPFTLSSIKKN